MLTSSDGSSLVVDRLCDQSRGQNTSVTCFYFDFAAREEQSATSILGSLLKQLISGMERIPEEISRVLQEQETAVSGYKPQLVSIVRMLQLITSSQRTFMVIDGLDECTPVQRFRLFDSLKEILENSPGSRIFVTGRPNICVEVETRLAARVTSISVGPPRGDIDRFLHFRLNEDETPDAMDESLEAEVLRKVPENTAEMWVSVMTPHPITLPADISRFLLASLNIGAILQESTIYRRRETLSKMRDGLGLEGVYGATIKRIKAQGGGKSRLGMEALMWISHAERPLSLDELCHALAIELGSTDFNTGNVPSISILVDSCQGLITVNKAASTVRLVHFTLREYLSAHHDLFDTPHSAMAEICLTYLNSGQVKALSANPSANPNTVIHDKPFLEYCSLYWGAHAQRELSDCARSLALQLFREYDGHISGRFLFAKSVDYQIVHYGGFHLSPLHYASGIGIMELLAALLEMECYDINEGDYWGHTPLAWAARHGHDEIVKMFLEQEGVDPNKPSSSGKTPLSNAAEGGHEGVVRLLLGRGDINPDKPDNWGLTPLALAAEKGYEGVVRALLRREEVNPDKPDNWDRTPLAWAARMGYEGVVRALLEREEVNPDKPDKRDRTPLAWATRNGYEGVVRALLGREEVNPGKPDHRGKTPLMRATWHGHLGVIALLQASEAATHHAI